MYSFIEKHKKKVTVKEVKILDRVLETMTFPVDNLLGMFLYVLLFVVVAILGSFLALTFIPNRFSYAIKSTIMGLIVSLALLLWWFIIVT